MQFSHIIGQQHVIQQLQEMVDHNRLSHALLFIGKEGSGALPLALAFSSYVVTQSEKNKPVATTAGLFGDEPVASSSSHGAELAEQYIHPDIHYSYPVIPRKSGDKPVSTDYITEWREFIKLYPYGNVYDWLQFIGAENKQGNITAAECADIIRKLNLKSFESEYKILLLWMPEYLGNEGNKLLKLIEEPPANTLFILVAENESLVLPTIISRCQTVRIPPIDLRDTATALVQRSKLSEEQAMQIAGVSEGNYREALQLIQHAEEDWQSLLREWLNAVLKSGPIAQVKWVDVISGVGREKQKQFLRYFTHLLEQSIRLRTMGEEHLPLTGAEKDFAIRLNKLCDISQQQAITQQLDEAAYHIERNANAKMLFMALTIKLYHIIANKTVIEVG
ncbi:hypothetical protein [Lacibacter sp.]|uniref:DNA polymerase III subunit n=1 Tax=Lacibacter sp. TaxID=1915409 RepID=UPI002B4ABE06|nr:hypothetical protein [Lacibacter sp.]HLP36161.1 hypothetical protein [Lacibacter sp.]